MKKFIVVLSFIVAIFFIESAVSLRIISLSPNITEMLFAIGAGSEIVGIDSASDTPVQTQKLPVVADYQQINLEKIIALHPDMVLAWPTRSQQESLQQLQQFSIPVHYITATHLTDVAKNLQQLGSLTQHKTTAAQLSTQYLHDLAQLQREYSFNKQITVFYELWQRPLLTLNQQSIVGQIIELCGAKNIFAQQSANDSAVALETVIALQPKIIIITNAANAALWHKWLPQSQVLQVSANQFERYTPLLMKSASQLCARLHKIMPE